MNFRAWLNEEIIKMAGQSVVYANPTPGQLQSLLDVYSSKPNYEPRGIPLCTDGNVFVWDGVLMHNNVASELKIHIDVGFYIVSWNPGKYDPNYVPTMSILVAPYTAQPTTENYRKLYNNGYIRKMFGEELNRYFRAANKDHRFIPLKTSEMPNKGAA